MTEEEKANIESAPVAADSSGPSPVQSLSRGLDILSQFTAESKALTLTELSRRTGLHKATIYRFVKTLEMEGYLTATGSGGYSIGPAWATALYVLGSDTVFEQILSNDLRSLAEATLETVALGVRRGDNVQIVHVLPPARSFVPTLPPSRIHPLHSTWNVHCQLLLAFAGEETRRRMLAVPQTPYTPHTVVDPKALAARLDRVFKAKVATEREEFHMGTCAVGVPIMARGKAVAALALVVPVERFTESALPTFVEQLRSAVSDMERRLAAPNDS